MTSPLRRKHRTTPQSSRESSINHSRHPQRAVAYAGALALAILTAASQAHADNAWNTTTPQPKLVWHAVRPSRPDAPVQDSNDKAKQAAKYEPNVFDDDPAPMPSKQVKLASGETVGTRESN